MSIQTISMNDFEQTKKLCEMLMKTPHYAKIGDEGVFAIVQTASSLGIDPATALGGGLYYVKGRVEMSSRMMNSLIRSRGHSISKDPKSDDSICILYGKRGDNGDIWRESFSLKDAQNAGIAGVGAWKTFPRDMLFARALSRLARQLFPDVIGNVYIQGEVALDHNIKGVDNSRSAQELYAQLSDANPEIIEPQQEEKTIPKPEPMNPTLPSKITEAQLRKINELLETIDDREFERKLLDHMEGIKMPSLQDLTMEKAGIILRRCEKQLKDREASHESTRMA